MCGWLPYPGVPQMFIHLDVERTYLHESSLSGKTAITKTTYTDTQI